MNNKLYVGNLSYNVNDAQLSELFTQVGKVISVKVITDRTTGRSKGFGFVEMESAEDAQKAIETLNETELEGRKMLVNEARPQKPRPSY